MADLVTTFWPAGLVVAAIALAIAIARALSEDRPPLEKRPSLLTEAEQLFYKVLGDAVSGRFAIMLMVRLADVIQVKGEPSDRSALQGKIDSKHLDFVLCDHGSLAPRLAIELDDTAHEPDRFVDAGLAAAGLPLLRIRASGQYDAKELRGTIEKLTGEKR